ncbi:hypothetical protein PPYR_01175 [Photinus pyralis]|uniref:NOC3-like protein n=1 Tax=Photinus pyralis TaxID=7054 RepID=A0A5N4ACC4_PHOPY|nr:nucleolar complex protein 3 homolog [Photinus pyralis]KAB0794961.1 hypothetical protein PPYR_11800 [Photinus pyralis]KAB0804205.1 hypothetical protein PPYR_01175 [Photinus pyralis]
MAKKTHSLKVKNKKSQSKSFAKKSLHQKSKFKDGKSPKKNFMLTKHKQLKSKKKKKEETGKEVLTPKVFSHENKKIVEELYSSKFDTQHEVGDWDMLEEEYENLYQQEETTLTKHLLPIKTKTGIVPVVEEISNEADEPQISEDEVEENEVEEEPKVTTTITAAELLVRQSKTVGDKKIQIGSLSASILEDPNEKIDNLRILVKMLERDEVNDSLIIKKMVIMSLVEVFKDLLPSYRFKEDLDKSVKLKKETLKLNKFESTILQSYKKFLRFLAIFSSVLIKQQGRTATSNNVKLRLGEISVNALSELLQAHPYFNYSENIAQVVIPFLNHSNSAIREKVKLMCKTIFSDDLKSEITLKIVRLINHYLKKFDFVIHTEMLDVLLFLKIKEVNMDNERIQKLKQKKLQSHKGNILKLSKNEKKRAARVKEVEKALMEAKAEESRQGKQKNVTEITKFIFGIFFKVLKNSTNTKIVGICLQGVAQFAHCLSIEFYMDLIAILGNLLQEDWMAYTEKQKCIQTIFAILCQQGEVFNFDPAGFYSNIYEELLTVHCGHTYKDFSVVLDTLIYALVKRQKKISQKRMASFLKRLATLSLQVSHDGALSCLAICKSLLQSNTAMDILLDLESSWGDGSYQPELNDPEYCNASNSALYELSLLYRHYHPTVSEYSRRIAHGTSASTEGLPNVLSRASADEIFKTFDMSQMCFSPSIPILKNVPKNKIRHKCNDLNFVRNCKTIIKNEKCGILS